MTDAPKLAEVVPLYNNGSCQTNERCGLASRLCVEAEAVANVYAHDIAGYVMVCVNSKGVWSLSYEMDPDSPIGMTMLAGLAMAAIQRDMLAKAAARDLAEPSR